MKPGREIDTRIATEVFGFKVWARGKELFETSAEQGERPLRHYCRDMDAAWSVAAKLKMALIPIEKGNWFAFVGPSNLDGWPSPEAMMKVLEEKKFESCGAAVGFDPAMVICEAALKAMEKRRKPVTLTLMDEPPPQAPDLH